MNFNDWFRYKFIPWVTSLGITKRTVTLEVSGRKSGKPVRVSLSRTFYGGRAFFVSLGGESNWVRNVRAAQGKAIILYAKRRPVTLIEFQGPEKPAILHAYVQERAFMHSGPESARIFFGLGPNPTVEEMEPIAVRYVIFEIRPEHPGA